MFDIIISILLFLTIIICFVFVEVLRPNQPNVVMPRGGEGVGCGAGGWGVSVYLTTLLLGRD